MTTLQTSTAPERTERPWTALLSGRVLSGLIYGLLLSLVYVWVSQMIDSWMMRDVPLAVDWPAAITAILTTTLGGAALGIVVAWPRDGWKGVLVGAVVGATAGLVRSFVLVSAAALIFLPLLLPLVLLALPVSLLLRWVVDVQGDAESLLGLAWLPKQALLIVIVVGVAAFAGSWSQMPATSQAAVRRVYREVQFMLGNPAQPLSVSFKDIPNLRQSVSSSYTLTQHPANISPNGVVVDVLFSSGYGLACAVDHPGAVPLCYAGRNLFTGAGGPAYEQQ